MVISQVQEVIGFLLHKIGNILWYEHKGVQSYKDKGMQTQGMEMGQTFSKVYFPSKSIIPKCFTMAQYIALKGDGGLKLGFFQYMEG